MRKITAILLSCVMIACSAVSCGNKDSKKDNDTSSEKKSSQKSLVGTYEFDMNGQNGLMIFNEDNIDMASSMNDFFHMEGDSPIMAGEDISDVFSYDGKTLSIVYEGNDVMTLERTGKADKDTYNGEYEILSGIFKDQYATNGDLTDIDVTVLIDGDNTYIEMKDIISYEIDGDTLNLINKIPSVLGNNEEAKVQFELSGDTLTLTKESDEGDEDEPEVIELKRIK